MPYLLANICRKPSAGIENGRPGTRQFFLVLKLDSLAAFEFNVQALNRKKSLPTVSPLYQLLLQADLQFTHKLSSKSKQFSRINSAQRKHCIWMTIDYK